MLHSQLHKPAAAAAADTVASATSQGEAEEFSRRACENVGTVPRKRSVNKLPPRVSRRAGNPAPNAAAGGAMIETWTSQKVPSTLNKSHIHIPSITRISEKTTVIIQEERKGVEA